MATINTLKPTTAHDANLYPVGTKSTDGKSVVQPVIINGTTKHKWTDTSLSGGTGGGTGAGTVTGVQMPDGTIVKPGADGTIKFPPFPTPPPAPVDKSVKGGAVSPDGTTLTLNLADGTKIPLDLSNVTKAAKVAGGSIDPATGILTIVNGDGSKTTINLANSIKIAHDNSLTGDGTTASPLVVKVSSNPANIIKVGSDGGVYAEVPKTLTDAKVQSGVVTGNTLTITTAGGEKINIDVTELKADIKLTKAIYDNATKEIVLTLSDGSTLKVPVGELLPVTTDKTLTGNGASTPLSVAISTDPKNSIKLGLDGAIYAEDIKLVKATYNTTTKNIDLTLTDNSVVSCSLDALISTITDAAKPVDNLLSNDPNVPLSANQGRLLSGAGVASGSVSGNTLNLKTKDGSTIPIDISALLVDVKLDKGVYNTETKAIDLTLTDGKIISVSLPNIGVTGGTYNPATGNIDLTLADGTKINVPFANLFKVVHDNTIKGDGTTASPLSVDFTNLASSDPNNPLSVGSDGKLKVTIPADVKLLSGSYNTTTKAFDLVLTDGSIVKIPYAPATPADVKLTSGVYNTTTKAFDLTLTDGSIVKIPYTPSASNLISADAGNLSVLGTDGKVFTKVYRDQPITRQVENGDYSGPPDANGDPTFVGNGTFTTVTDSESTIKGSGTAADPFAVRISPQPSAASGDPKNAITVTPNGLFVRQIGPAVNIPPPAGTKIDAYTMVNYSTILTMKNRIIKDANMLVSNNPAGVPKVADSVYRTYLTTDNGGYITYPMSEPSSSTNVNLLHPVPASGLLNLTAANLLSTNAGNALRAGTDGKLFVPPASAPASPDVKLASGVYNATTKSLDLKLSDNSIVSVPVAPLLPVTTDGTTLLGDGSTTPLSVGISSDKTNRIVKGTDGKLLVKKELNVYGSYNGTVNMANTLAGLDTLYPNGGVDVVIIGGTSSIDMGAAVPIGRQVIVKSPVSNLALPGSPNAFTITSTGGSVDGQSSYVITRPNESVTLVADGKAWCIV